MIDTRCGLRCEGCEYIESCNCGGCIATNGNPFHGACPVAECCQSKGREPPQDHRKRDYRCRQLRLCQSGCKQILREPGAVPRGLYSG